jgi:hypothetical protein
MPFLVEVIQPAKPLADPLFTVSIVFHHNRRTRFRLFPNIDFLSKNG